MKGSVLVIGGGVAGIQSSLDLAEGGFKVYLLEKGLSIGGVMAQLDKTFPTNDCSMCILSPKMVEAGRHLNIELITGGELLSVDGEPGNFKVKIKKNARYVDLEKCKGCGDCAEACPVEVLHPYEENLTLRKAIWRPFDQAVPSAFAIDKKGTPPCRARCPVHLNAHGYVMAVKAGEWKRAQEIVRKERDFVFAATAARICTHPCEGECKRSEVDSPVAIRTIKRFVTDWEFREYGGPEIDTEIKEERDKKVAIIGAGPAGLSCAFDLRKLGYKVTVFEKLPKGGGMLLTGIPPYRLPKDILEREVKVVEGLVEVRYNTPVDRELFREILNEYDAVFIATGAHKSRGMGIPGEDLEGVYHAVSVLKKINFGEPVDLGKRVMVVGGGNSAMDAARSALRLGCEVMVVYRRSRAEMPAIPEEVEAAMEEGIEFHFLRNPVEFIGRDGRLERVRLIKMELGEPDESGRRRPVPVPGSEYEVEVSSVLLAIGERPDLSFVDGIELTPWGTVKVDELTLQTSNPKVFAGGDCVTGPNTFIDAVAHGKRAAVSIHRFLEGKDLKEGREGELPWKSELAGDKSLAYRKGRIVQPHLPVEERIKTFSEVELTPAEEDIREEARRCINCSVCSECGLCVLACEPEAIVHDMVDRIEEIEVGAIVVATGFEEFDPTSLGEYGYGRYKNVVTSIQFERILSASGPFRGEVKRPKDGKHPERIAWIQCVGSRDKERPYCSSVCCMYAVKEAVIAREHDPRIKPTIFFMDVRSYGKDFEMYVERAKSEYGVRFVYARPASVEEDPETGDLWIRYEENGELKKEKFDLVVLSVGFVPPPESRKLAEILGIEVDEFGFAKTSPDEPVKTTREGIFVVGAFQGPKDIPESVAQASSGAALAGAMLSEARGSEIRKKEYPPERFVLNEKPRIGVFVCHCGINIGAYVDVKEVVEYAKTLPGVVYAEDNLYTCSQDSQERIKEIIKEYKLNRVVVASCTPRTHEPLFQETLREAGLNPYLFEMANIRDQNSWVHMHEKREATEKAKDLVRSAVAKAYYLEPLEREILPITRKGLVIGGGVAGMKAALVLADSGYETYLVEKEPELGGKAVRVRRTIEGLDTRRLVDELKKKVKNHPLIKVFTGVRVKEVEGFVGNYHTTLSNGEVLEHGVVIIATGAEEYVPHEYNYGKDPRVMTQFEYAEALEEGRINPEVVVMIQCVGSRNDEHPYCSRVCCSEAVKNALLTLEKNPRARIFVLYRDIRTYGKKEVYYRLAREKGVIFIRYTPERPPVLEDGFKIKVYDPILQDEVVIEPDYLVLSTGIVAPREENERLSKLFKVPLNQDGFFLEAHMKLRPVEFATDGVFLCGLAHGPKTVEESIAQAYAAVSRACTLLSKDGIEAVATTARVDERKCVGCGYCEMVCAYGAVSVVEKRGRRVAEVNPALCKGCGACSGACRSGAIDLRHFTDSEVVRQITSLAGV